MGHGWPALKIEVKLHIVHNTTKCSKSDTLASPLGPAEEVSVYDCTPEKAVKSSKINP